MSIKRYEEEIMESTQSDSINFGSVNAKNYKELSINHKSIKILLEVENRDY